MEQLTSHSQLVGKTIIKATEVYDAHADDVQVLIFSDETYAIFRGSQEGEEAELCIGHRELDVGQEYRAGIMSEEAYDQIQADAMAIRERYDKQMEERAAIEDTQELKRLALKLGKKVIDS